MLYTIIDKDKGEQHGFRAVTHRIIKGKMILNENDLRRLGEDITSVATMLEGEILTHSELINKIKTMQQ